MFKLRFDDAGKQIYMCPQDVIENTIRRSRQRDDGDRLLRRGADRPLLRAGERPDCIEVDNNAGFGDCGGSGSIVLTGPLFQQHDIRFAKRTTIVGRTNFEFAAELLNAFNQAELPPGGASAHAGSAASATPRWATQVTGLSGTNTSRVIQIVTRLNW